MKVIVLGGYGGFGARLSRRLAADGWQVFIAGRSAEAAEALAASLPNAQALVIDRNGDLSPVLKSVRPFLLIDAAGPFQGSDYHVVHACIAAKVHYLDLADARDFVCGIGTLDADAKSAGVVVVSGASSVPALSGAVVAELVQELDAAYTIEMSISASNRATAGASVASAILSSVGRSVRLWRVRQWQNAIGWHMIRREVYAVDGEAPLRRSVALVDVPDHSILPERLPGKPDTVFRAGPEFSFQLRTLWMLSWLVRWGWVSSLSSMSRWLLPLQGLTGWLGSDRSAMKVAVKGTFQGTPVIRTWTLIASRGDGPEIPTLAAQIIAQDVRAGRLLPGARHASGTVGLGAFEEKFAKLAIRTERRAQRYTPLYRRVMGQRFGQLPKPVQEMHDIVGDATAEGSAEVTRGTSLPARVIAAIIGFPLAGTHSVRVTFDESDGKETWIRDFSGVRFSSELSQVGDKLVERFGPLRFHFDLPSDVHGLEMQMRKWSMFSIRLPMFLAPRSVAKETADGEDFLFDVRIALPLIGNIVHYHGRLRRV
jgi:NAD(P)-dependent dehydrogenase (short-subunit alcohol dehydrogenase family)